MSPSSRPEPPSDGRSPAPAPSVTCPHCQSVDVEVESPFGGNLMTRQYYCLGCHTVFEWVKWEIDPDPAGWLKSRH